MFGDYVLEESSAQYENKILLVDDNDLEATTHYKADFLAHGFEVIRYSNDLSFRMEYEDKLNTSDKKIVVVAHSSDYVPYDIQKRLRAYTLSLSRLFPKLNVDVLREQPRLDYDLLCMAYKKNFDNLKMRPLTEQFIQRKVYSKANLQEYLSRSFDELMDSVTKAKTYKDWIAIAEQKAHLDVLATKYEIALDTSEINRLFKDYVLTDFGKLSSIISRDTPVLVSRAMEYMHDQSEKFVIIVMDGMSEFDWNIISASFEKIPYEQSAAFAMIPTTTSVSRQCLLSNKYPSQLMEPWKQSKEKAEFTACAKSLGYKDNQIEYGRGYDVEFGSFVKCGAVIINDVDDMVHAQPQGRLGMLNDISVLANQAKLANMTKRFLASGFDVYITADHGNTHCTGLGKLMGTGVELETKSRRMLVLKDFADKETLIQKYGLIDFSKNYYLMGEYDYLICDVGDSFDAKGEDVMSHGGITLDEVIVPFIKVKAVTKNG